MIFKKQEKTKRYLWKFTEKLNNNAFLIGEKGKQKKLKTKNLIKLIKIYVVY